LVNNPTLIVDPGSSTASGWLHVRNNTSVTQAVTLSASDFTSTDTSHFLGAKVLLDATGMSFTTLGAMPPGGTVPVRIEVSNLWDAGESTAVLYTNGLAFATLRAVRDRVPFKVTMEGTPVERPEMLFNSGHPVSLILRNDDPMTYIVRWELDIDGRVVTNATTRLPPTSTTVATDLVSKGIFRGGPCSWLKDEVRDGQLRLSWQATAHQASPSRQGRTIPIRVRLSTTATFWTVCGYVLLGVVLACGGICSLLLNNFLPNRLRRFEFQEQLAKLTERTRNLSPLIDSSLRVLVRVQRQRLSSLLNSRNVFSPDLTNVFTQATAGIGTLSRQLDLLERIDAVYDRIDSTTSTGRVPPTLLDLEIQSLRRASQLLRNTSPPESDLQACQALIAEAVVLLDKLGQANEVLAVSIAKRIGFLRSEITRLADDLDFLRVKQQLPTLVPSVVDQAFEQPANIPPEVYCQLDMGARKLELMLQYLNVLRGAGNPDRIQALRDREPRLLEYLALEDVASLRQAERLVREMCQGIFDEKMAAEIKANALTIEIDQVAAHPSEPLQFRAVFRKPPFNSAAAREGFTCIWNFDDGLSEKGWTVMHYFLGERLYHVGVTFVSPDGEELPGTKKLLAVKGDRKDFIFGDRTWTELARVGIALALALLALLGGARQQLMQLDFVPGLIAVFLLGFGADQFKNLLTNRAQ
jgi:hypothetical protein